MPYTPELFILFFLSTILLFFFSQRLLSQHTRPREPRSEVNSVSRALASVTMILNPPHTSLHQLLQERACANYHLARTLNLTNTFVDADPDIHTKFVQLFRRLLQNAQSSSGWTRFQDTCGRAVELSLHEYPSILSNGDEDIPFANFIQIVVLRTILVGFLNIGKDVDELAIRSLASVAINLNELWTHSKSWNEKQPETSVPASAPLSHLLHSHLQQLVSPESGFANPIDFIVPTWETMWRVCATVIARIQEEESYEDLFKELLHAEVPINRQFYLPIGPHGFSVQDFVVESMRLHPPIKRISRIRNCTTNNTISDFFHHIFSPRISSDVSGRVVADIETILRDPEIWSKNSLLFDPRRYREQPATEGAQQTAQAEALKLVFGHGPLRCVAASWAPIAAAVISANIVTQLREAGLKVISGERIGRRSGWDGWKIRRRSSPA